MMKIELRNLKINNTFEKEVLSYKGTLYIEDIKTAFVTNDGMGGNTNIFECSNKTKKLLSITMEYCKTLPKAKNIEIGIDIEMSLELLVDELAYNEYIKIETEKNQKIIDKKCENSVVFGNLNTNRIMNIALKGNPKFSEVIQVKGGKDALVRLVQSAKKYMQKDDIIFNKNLEGII